MIMQVQIPAVRNILNRCWFDSEKCANGISALKNFRAEYDEKKKKLGNRYLHDWSSHAAMAFVVFAVGYAPPKPTMVYHQGYETLDAVVGF